MQDDLEHPPRGYTTADISAQPAGRARRWRRGPLIVAALVLIPLLLFALFTC